MGSPGYVSDISSFRCLLFVMLLAFFIFIILFDESDENTGGWYSKMKHSSRHIFNSAFSQLKEHDYVIPVNQRRPLESVAEYYAKRDETLITMLVTTRGKFTKQHHLGTVMKDGFHTDLPNDAMWKDGKIEIGSEIQEQAESAASLK